MSSDLLNDRVIKVTGITKEAAGNVVCMLYALKDITRNWELRALSELCSLNLGLVVDVLHPAVVVGGRCLRDMLLEDDNVGVGNLDSVG